VKTAGTKALHRVNFLSHLCDVYTSVVWVVVNFLVAFVRCYFFFQGGNVIAFVCPFVCLSVIRIMHRKFSSNFCETL